jgi:hypothetical protein
MVGCGIQPHAEKTEGNAAMTATGTEDVLKNLKVLVEDLRDSVAMVAAHVADISQRLPPRA